MRVEGQRVGERVVLKGSFAVLRRGVSNVDACIETVSLVSCRTSKKSAVVWLQVVTFNRGYRLHNDPV